MLTDPALTAAFAEARATVEMLDQLARLVADRGRAEPAAAAAAAGNVPTRQPVGRANMPTQRRPA